MNINKIDYNIKNSNPKKVDAFKHRITDWKQILKDSLVEFPVNEAAIKANIKTNENSGSWKYLSKLSGGAKVLVYPSENHSAMFNLARSCDMVYVCDPNKEVLQFISVMAESLDITNFKFINIDNNDDFPFPSNFFDLIFFGLKYSVKTFNHHSAIISEFSRVLKSEGELFIITHNHQPHKMIKNLLVLNKEKGEKDIIKTHPISKWIKALKSNGFECVSIFERDAHSESLTPYTKYRNYLYFHENWKIPQISILAGKKKNVSFLERLLESKGYNGISIGRYHISLMGNVKVEVITENNDKILLILPSTKLAQEYVLNGMDTIGVLHNDKEINSKTNKLIPSVKNSGVFENQFYIIYDWMIGESGFSNPSHLKNKNRIIEQAFNFLDNLFIKMKTLSEGEIKSYIRTYIDDIIYLCDRPGDIDKLKIIQDTIISDLKSIEIPISYIHGDYAIHNIIFKENSSIISGIIDWEFGSKEQIGLIDYFQLIFSINAHFEPNYMGDRVVNYWKDKSYNSWVDQKFVELFAKKNINKKHFSAMLLLYWLHSVSKQSSFNFHRFFDTEWKEINVYQVLDLF